MNELLTKYNELQSEEFGVGFESLKELLKQLNTQLSSEEVKELLECLE